jgi:hypothetical protein
MILDDLTSDNIHLSRPKMPDSCEDFAKAIHGRTLVDEHVSSLVRDSLADNTRRAYPSDLAHFENWGGQVPATDELIASYLAAHADTTSPATLQRRVASLSKAHRALAQLAQSALLLASRFVAAPESNQGVGCLCGPDLGCSGDLGYFRQAASQI